MMYVSPIAFIFIIWLFWHALHDKTDKEKAKEARAEERAKKRAKYDEEHPFPLSTVEQFLSDEVKESICGAAEKDEEDDDDDDDERCMYCGYYGCCDCGSDSCDCGSDGCDCGCNH